jgi:hypothetical protein
MTAGSETVSHPPSVHSDSPIVPDHRQAPHQYLWEPRYCHHLFPFFRPFSAARRDLLALPTRLPRSHLRRTHTRSAQKGSPRVEMKKVLGYLCTVEFTPASAWVLQHGKGLFLNSTNWPRQTAQHSTAQRQERAHMTLHMRPTVTDRTHARTHLYPRVSPARPCRWCMIPLPTRHGVLSSQFCGGENTTGSWGRVGGVSQCKHFRSGPSVSIVSTCLLRAVPPSSVCQMGHGTRDTEVVGELGSGFSSGSPGSCIVPAFLPSLRFLFLPVLLEMGSVGVVLSRQGATELDSWLLASGP